MKKQFSFLLCLLMLGVLCACGQSAPAAPSETAEPSPPATSALPSPLPSPAVADLSQMTAVEEVVEDGMTPVYADSLVDGDYPVQVKSSSSMFRIGKAVLHVRDGSLSASLTINSKSYLSLYPGSALEAATADDSGHIPYAEDEDGAYTFVLPLEALDAPTPCAAFSKNKQLWYDRTLLFRADSLPLDAFREGSFTTAESLGLEDGDYTVSVTLSGGSGRASVQSPCRLRVDNGICTAEIVWGSGNYDYMKVDGEVYLPVNPEGNSVFWIPAALFDRNLPVIADTVAMSQPHEIAYALRFDSASITAAP